MKTEIEKYVKLLDEINDDTESAHARADHYLLDYLRATNQEAVADAWERAADRHNGFWYA